jgi:hypothetical protein
VFARATTLHAVKWIADWRVDWRLSLLKGVQVGDVLIGRVRRVDFGHGVTQRLALLVLALADGIGELRQRERADASGGRLGDVRGGAAFRVRAVTLIATQHWLDPELCAARDGISAAPAGRASCAGRSGRGPIVSAAAGWKKSRERGAEQAIGHETMQSSQDKDPFLRLKQRD